MRDTGKECRVVYLLGVLLGFVLMRFGFGPAGVSMHLRPEYDLNIYYLIGQGWMQGILPYAQLTDLKGPLVFLLHGLGARLTPGSFSGACVLESLLLGVGVLYAYRTARLFFSVGISLGVMGAYSLSMLYFSLHPAEIIWVLQQVALFYLLRRAVRGELPDARQQFLLGVSVGVVLLVKFNQAAFWVPFCLWGVVVAGRKWWRSGLLQLAGVGAVLVPVLGYFYAQGALAQLWQEYVMLAVRYGSTGWAESALANRGWLLAAEMLPLHLHQALSEIPAAVLGWGMLLPCVLLPVLLRGAGCWEAVPVLVAAWLLLVAANYSSAHCYIHYSFVFSVYWLVGLLVLAHCLRRVMIWAGSCVLVGVLVFAVGLPIAVKYLKPHNGNAEMRAATLALTDRLARGGHGEVVVLDAAGGLHFYRLTHRLPVNLHFIPSLVPGGFEQHRAELADYIRERKPRYLVGSAACAEADAAWLQRVAPACYEVHTHAQLGLPVFPAAARRPEYMLYTRR